MGIEISGNNSRPLGNTQESGKSQATAAPAGASRGGAPGKTSTAGGDQLQLSSQAEQLKALEAEIANLPVVDTQRVQDVRHTLATGSFQIEPAEVADKMLEFESGLGPEG
jgi:negative regulator of flagellin synthesis FlgM